MKANTTTSSNTQNSSQSLQISHVRQSPRNIPTTKIARYQWEEPSQMFMIKIQVRSSPFGGGGGSSSVFETHMGFDTGSTALCVFPTELHLLLHDFTYIQFTNSSLPVGSVRADAFQIRVRVLSEEGEQLVDWIYDTAACLSEGQVRLSSFALQENAFVTIVRQSHSVC